MGGSDGSIIIDTELDQTGFEKGSAKLEHSIKNLTGQIEKIGEIARNGFISSAQLTRFNEKVESAQNTVAKLQDQLTELGKKTISTSAYEQLNKELIKTEDNLNRLYQRQGVMRDLGVSEHSQQWKRLELQIQQAEDQLARYQERIAKMERDGSSFVMGVDTAEYAALSEALDEARAKLNELTPEKISSLRSAFITLGNTIKSAATHVMELAKKVAKIGVDAVGKKFKSFTNRLKEFVSRSKTASVSANGLVKALTSVKSMLKSRIKRMFISYLMNEIKSAMSALVQYSSEFDGAISGMRNSTTELAGNLAVSFSNLVNAVAPAITSIINLLSQATSYLSAFFAMLGGKSTVTIAKKQTDSYADSLRDAAGAAKDLDKANKTLGIDELNVFSNDSDVGGAGDASDMYEDVSIDNLLPEDVSNWFERIKAAFKNGDWYGIGHIIADGLNSALGVVNGWIDGTLRPAAVTWAARIAEPINGLVDGLDWTQLGKTFAGGLNTVFDTANTFLTTLNFKNLGFGIGKALNGLFDTLDWGLVGATFANGWNALIDLIYGIVTTVDWPGLGSSIATAVMSWFDTINWDTLALAVAIGLNGITAAFYAFLTETDWRGMATQLGGSINTMFSTTDWGMIGQTIVEGFNTVIRFLDVAIVAVDWWSFGTKIGDLLKSAIYAIDWASIGSLLSDGVIGLGTAIIGFVSEIDWTDLGYNLVNGIGNAIKSVDWGGIIAVLGSIIVVLKSSVIDLILGEWAGVADFLADCFSALGLDSVAGFLQGIADGLLGIGAWIKTNVIDPVVNWFMDLLGIHSPSTVFSELGYYAIQGLLLGISNAWSSITEFFTGAISALVSMLSSVWTNIKSTASTAWSGIKSTVTSTFENAKSGVLTTAENLKSGLSSKWSELVNAASTWGSDICSNIASGIKGAVGTVTSAVSSVANKIKDFLGFSEPDDGPLSDFHTYMPDMMKSMAQGINDNLNLVENAVSSVASSIIQIMDGGLNIVNGLFADLATGVLDYITTVGTEYQNGLNTAHSSTKKFTDSTTQMFGNMASQSVSAIQAIISSLNSIPRNITTVHTIITKNVSDGGGASTSGTGTASISAVGANPVNVSPVAAVGTSQYDSVQTYAGGTARTFAAIADTLAAMGGLQVPAIASGNIVPYQTRIAPSSGGATSADALGAAMTAGNAGIIAVLYEMLERLERAIEQNGGDFYIGDDQIVRSYNRGNRARGIQVSRGAFSDAY